MFVHCFGWGSITATSWLIKRINLTFHWLFMTERKKWHGIHRGVTARGCLTCKMSKNRFISCFLDTPICLGCAHSAYTFGWSVWDKRWAPPLPLGGRAGEKWKRALMVGHGEELVSQHKQSYVFANQLFSCHREAKRPPCPFRATKRKAVTIMSVIIPNMSVCVLRVGAAQGSQLWGWEGVAGIWRVTEWVSVL